MRSAAGHGCPRGLKDEFLKLRLPIKENWGYWIRFGNFPVLIDHRAGMHYCVVAFQITLKEEGAIVHLNEFYDRNDAQFIFELHRAFSSPLTAFSRIIEQGRVIGFTVSKYIYPYHSDFQHANPGHRPPVCGEHRRHRYRLPEMDGQGGGIQARERRRHIRRRPRKLFE